MNKAQRDHIWAVTGVFDHDKVHVDMEHATEPHYTAVVHTHGTTHDALVRLQQTYRESDDSLQFVDPELLHVTLGTAHIPEGHEKLAAVTQRYIAQKPIVRSAGLVATDVRGALGVAFWSDDDIFLRFRRELAEIYKKDFKPNPRVAVGWATLARFTQRPSGELIKFIQNNMFMELGEMPLDTATIYIPTRRDLKNSQFIAKI